MRPYSEDLRRRVVKAYLNREGTQRDLARRFSVSTSFVQNVVRRYRETGEVKPKPHRGGYPILINDSELETIARLTVFLPSATVGKLCEEFSQIAGFTPSRATMWRAVKKLKGLPGPLPDVVNEHCDASEQNQT